ncbi:hypothetical protein [Bacillus piscicola]|uniref:hypothetical protein n=1 Tax=Bacillus piscicola TaxID=1632684 RepID=UPI001F08B76F|nr:hypothetical protein [Bacillus piscicola]
MERVIQDQRLYSLRKIEKAIGNAEEVCQAQTALTQLEENRKAALLEARDRLAKAWNYYFMQKG